MNIESFLNNGDPAILLKAMLNVRRDFQATERLEKKVHSDDWVNHSHYRNYLLQQIHGAWSRITGEPDYDCPFTADLIVSMWIATRKTSYTEQRLEATAMERKEHDSLFCGQAV